MSRLGGLAVYDDDRNLTWLADANYAQTSCYDADGRMFWNDANVWVDSLNIGGYTGWRLPLTDTICGFNYNCTNSEMGHLFYIEGGLAQEKSINSSNYLKSFFTNRQDYYYWSGNWLEANHNLAWDMIMSNGHQDWGSNDNFFYAWAVYSGDVGGGGSVPEPGILGLMGIGALAWSGTRSRRLG